MEDVKQETDQEPLVWCLLGRKPGDNTQVRALADELNFDQVEKNILAQPWELLVHLGEGPSLLGIDRGNSSPLVPPWPDLVISAGRRNEPVARWIQHKSGGKTRLVHIGRPWAPLYCYDLIVTTPQYFLPRQYNVHYNLLPLQRHMPYELDQAAESLPAMVQDLPRPWIVLLAGGDSGKFVFTTEKAARLGVLASQLAKANKGSLLVTDSRRTPVAAGDALEKNLTVPHFCYRWGRDKGTVNPYLGFLSKADAFVVTGESMSMVGESCGRGKPLYIFDMADAEDKPWWTYRHNFRSKPLSHRLLMKLGPQRMGREIGNMVNALVESGAASWLDEAVTSLQLPATRHTGEPSTNAELKATAAAVRRLLKQR